jgi:cell division protein FtsB
MFSILLLKNDPAEIGRMLAEEQARREQQKQQDNQRIEQEYAPHFEELRRLVTEKKAEVDRLEAQIAEEQARRGQ